MASALRLRILRICLEPHTNKEVASALHRDPASTLHHIRRLVRTGFLQAQDERRGARNAREVPYLSTRKSWNLSSPARDRAMLDAFLEEVALAPADEVDMARLGLRLSPPDMKQFEERLRDLLDDVAQWPDDQTAAPVSVFLAIHPDVSRLRAGATRADPAAPRVVS